MHNIILGTITNLGGMREHINDAVQAAGKGSEKLFVLIDDSLAGASQIKALNKKSGILMCRYESIVNTLQGFGSQAVRHYPDVFGRECVYTRFSDLEEIANKFAIHSENDSSENAWNKEPQTSRTEDLVLF